MLETLKHLYKRAFQVRAIKYIKEKILINKNTSVFGQCFAQVRWKSYSKGYVHKYHHIVD